MLRHRLPLLLLLALLGGCASTPTTYLTLASPSAHIPPSSTTLSGPTLLVDHVEMPPSIDRLYLTKRLDDHTLRIARHIRWIAPLGGMAQTVLSEDLGAQMPQVRVDMAGAPLPPGDPHVLQLRVRVLSFYPMSHSAQLHAHWYLLHHGRLVAEGRFQAQTPINGAAAAAAAGMSRLLDELAKTVAAKAINPALYSQP